MRSANVIIGPIVGALIIIAGIGLLIDNIYYYAPLAHVTLWLSIVPILLGIVTIVVTLLKGRRNKQSAQKRTS